MNNLAQSSVTGQLLTKVVLKPPMSIGAICDFVLLLMLVSSLNPQTSHRREGRGTM